MEQVRARLPKGDRLERELSALVNAAYRLTLEEVAIMWRTAPPRMPNPPLAELVEPNEIEADWTTQLFETIGAMAPAAFERLCQRLLRESGFTRVEVAGRSGDGGIDGIGVLRVNLVSSTSCSRASAGIARLGRASSATSAAPWSGGPTRA